MESGEGQATFTIEPPPQSVYASEQEAEEGMHAWTFAHGFNLSKRRKSTLPDNRVWSRSFVCDRAGAPMNTRKLTDSDRVRPMAGSKRCGCEMRLTLRAVDKNDPEGSWEIVHSTQDVSWMHNHPPSKDIRIHAAHRQRAATVRREGAGPASLAEYVNVHALSGVQTASIHASMLLQDPGSMTLPKDIANARYKTRINALATHTAIESLLARLTEQQFFFRFEHDPETSRLRYLIWAHPGMLTFYRAHPDVLIMDCTYKTNCYNLPLLNIIAMSAMNTVIPVAQCWLPGECQGDYSWAFGRLHELLTEYGIALPQVIITDRDLACLNALACSFPGIPSLLCRWHTNRNVLAKTRLVLGQVAVANPAPGQDKYENSWETDSFMHTYFAALDSRSEAEFDSARATLVEKSPVVSAYLDLHWWRFKERLVRAWTQQFAHYGYQDTSAVEGTHAKCKRWLQSSRGDLLTAFTKFQPWWITCESALRYETQKNATIVPQLLQASRYAAVVRLISVYALKETDGLWKAAKQIIAKRTERSVCTGSFRRVHGRPCLHELVVLIETNGQRFLRPEDFDRHWWIDRTANVTRPRLFEPSTIVSKRKATHCRMTNKKKKGERSTRRDPTWSERVDLNDPATLPPSIEGACHPDEVLIVSRHAPPAVPATVDACTASHKPSIPLLPTMESLLQAQSVVEVEERCSLQFLSDSLPARAWGYAGRLP